MRTQIVRFSTDKFVFFVDSDDPVERGCTECRLRDLQRKIATVIRRLAFWDAGNGSALIMSYTGNSQFFRYFNKHYTTCSGSVVNASP